MDYLITLAGAVFILIVMVGASLEFLECWGK